jgi:molecular chaperone DnaK
MAVLGIDLGTTFSAVAYLDPNGTPITLPNAEGELTTPSVVLFEANGDVVVGREAKRAALSEPARVAECVKRHMGERFFPRPVSGAPLTPQAISALILKKLKQDAERRLGPTDGAVITVPAYFDERRRRATAEAGRLAGLTVIDIVNEPTAAALAYAYGRLKEAAGPGKTVAELGRAMAAPRPPSTVLIYDLGGGTFDVTLLRIDGSQLTVLATVGDVRLGGRDWDERLSNYMAGRFVGAHTADPRHDPVAAQAVMAAAEEAKKVLSARREATWVVTHAGKALREPVGRDLFDRLTEDLLYRTENRVARVVRQAKLTWADVDEVLMVGGSTRMPQVAAMLRRVTGKVPGQSLSPDEAVAHGAAIHASIRALTRAAAAAAKLAPAAARPAPPNRSEAGMPPIPAARPSAQPVSPPPPAAAEPADDGDGGGGIPSPRLFDLFTGAVARFLRSFRTTNVNSHSLGVISRGADRSQKVIVLIPRNTALPASTKRSFGTAVDNQNAVSVRIVEGESENPEECVPVGVCAIQPLPRGLPKGSPIEVTFAYDASGRLEIQALERSTGTRTTVAIDRHSSPPGPGDVAAEQRVLRAQVV